MAFWLATKRKGQAFSYTQRFDPRFWTVNFPRPAMASVITTGPDSLRVDCEFLHKGELVGLIWESEDTLDHPLLAYETQRDYRYCSLSFHWRSDGLIALDLPNGPTLTIEGRDENGQPMQSYVRLWNYATGSPTDARIELNFSELASGWTLPGEAVFAGDIDRLFISLVPPGFVSDSEDAFALRKSAFVELSDIECDGAHAVLETGDIVAPIHGERIATAYDDSYNQTPARLLRNIKGLGYREEAVHYVGMSHFMQLEVNDSAIEPVQPASLCTPARQWHRNFFDLAKLDELDVIASISYELLNEYCPPSWRQMAHDGEPALTGWIPPSTVLSPANPGAMTWLQQAAAEFAQILEEAQQPVRMQIGEPWWWIASGNKPCLYDPSAVSAFGGSPVAITDLTAELDQGQLDLLDQAGQILAQSTADLASAIRSVASGSAEILLLAFTPTILADSMPEAHRANLPQGWAYPAFDRLQLEDYDWLTAGGDAARRNAYQFVNAKLGYPISSQDYLSGFVLSAEDAETHWRLIDKGLDEAAHRGVDRRFVWALPQVARDGYVRLPSLDPENEMQAFDDVLYPFALGRDVSVSPEFSTSIAVTSSGHERRNSLWSDARMHFDVGPGIRSEEEMAQILEFFRARRGASRGFRIGDPFDFSSNAMTGTPTEMDQLLGIGDGLASDFQLVKRYGSGDDAQVRRITRPRADTVVISVNGSATNEWTMGNKGEVQLHSAPFIGAEVRAGFLFDVPVRFAEDRLDISSVNFAAGEAPSITLVEVREDN